MRWKSIGLIGLAALSLMTTDAREETTQFELESPAITQGKRIPEDYTSDGSGDPPPLSWSGAPTGTKELVLVVEDPDAKKAPFIHWIVYGLSPDSPGIPQALAHATEGTNSLGKQDYVPPSPPKGDPPHHYHFKLYALDQAVPLKAGLDELALMSHIQEHIIGQAELVATYARENPVS